MIIIPDLSGVFKSIIDTFINMIKIISETLTNNPIIAISIAISLLVFIIVDFIFLNKE